MKLKHYMYNGLSICQTKQCKTIFRTLPRLSCTIINRPVAGKTTLLRQKSQQTHYYYRIATKLAVAYKYCCCSFNKISIKRKKLCCKKSLTQR